MSDAAVRTKISILAAALAIAVSVLQGEVSAQELERPGPRQGYYVGLGAFGTINANYRHEENEWFSPWPGVTGSLRFGESIAKWLDLGIGIGAGPSFDKNYLGVLGRLVMEAQFRPVEPLLLRAAAGFGFIDVSRRKQGLDAVTGRVGGAYGLSVGWEFFPFYDKGSGGFSIAPVVGVEVGPGAPLSSLTGFLGFEITFWTGLSKDKLDLSAEDAFK